MSAFGGLILTNKGRALQAKAQTSIELHFTKISLGDGELGGSSMLDLTSLKHEVKSLSLTKLKTLTDGKAVVGGILSNQGLTSGFYWRELGVFALDPDVGEILYCYGNAGANAEYIPAGGGADIVEKAIDVIILVGNASNITATIEQSLTFETPTGAQEKATEAETNAKVYTDAKLAELVAAAPAALDTLKELSAALGNDPNFATTVIKAIGLKADKSVVESHLADYVHQIGYATATGLTNTYSITLNPAPASLVDGLCVAVKINTQNTGASTINVNGLGVKSIKKANGNDLTSGNLKAGSIYTLRYNGINFILQGEGGEYGTATQDKVLSGYTIGTENGIVNGSMPNRGVFNLGLGESVQAGYYSGGTVPIGKKFAQGTVTSSDTGTISVSGLSFRPYVAVLMQNDVNTNDPGNCCSVVILTDFTTVYKLNSALSNGYGINGGYSDNYAQAGFYTVNQITNDGFTASKQQYGSISSNRIFKYYAYGA